MAGCAGAGDWERGDGEAAGIEFTLADWGGPLDQADLVGSCEAIPEFLGAVVVEPDLLILRESVSQNFCTRKLQTHDWRNKSSFLLVEICIYSRWESEAVFETLTTIRKPSRSRACRRWERSCGDGSFDKNLPAGELKGRCKFME